MCLCGYMTLYIGINLYRALSSCYANQNYFFKYIPRTRIQIMYIVPVWYRHCSLSCTVSRNAFNYVHTFFHSRFIQWVAFSKFMIFDASYRKMDSGWFDDFYTKLM